MNKVMFEKPKPGDVITVAVRYKNHILWREGEWDDRRYENVTVVPSDSWDKPDSFCIPAENHPYINKRSISLSNVIELVVNGQAGKVATQSETRFAHVKGSKGALYEVTIVGKHAKSCTCPGFTYRKHCKHLAMV